MTAQGVREKFVTFFVEKGHAQVPAASLVPQDDPSVLFTTAGMQQFKPFYTDPDKAPHKRIVTIQPCFRTSDIDEVGDDTHLTFFEMLGNFSFGYSRGKSDKKQVTSDKPDKPYFKQEAIKWAWEFITSPKWLNVAPERIEVSVFRGEKNIPLDEESIRVWRAIGVPDTKIKMGDREDTFWGPTGSEGPCGPTTELYIDGVEVWNIVFNEYYQDTDGNLIPSEWQGVDTGMGLERLLAVLNKKQTVYETDLYALLKNKLAVLKLPMVKERIVLDHIKSILFLIHDEIRPANLGREYILRRLLRRILVIEELHDSLPLLFKETFELYKKVYSLNESLLNKTQEVVATEWEQFQRTLQKGKVYIKKLNKTRVSGEDAFYIYSTFGIPIDAQKDLFGTAISVDSGGFEREYLESLERHKEVSRAGAQKKFGGHGLVTKIAEEIPEGLSPADYEKALHNHTATHLLHAALRSVLGHHVTQQGSDVSPERLRFDFSHPSPLSDQQKREVEAWVNARIKEDLPVRVVEMDKDEALRSGALAFFPDRYPQKCKVYTVGDPKQPVSKELCGGPHVTHTGEIGTFRITSEKSSSAGVRRIKAVTG